MMADLENGLWAGDVRDAPAPSIKSQFVTAMAKGRKGGFALKAGDAQGGSLQTLHEGNRPPGYSTMRKQGSIILGIGGDNSCHAVGTCTCTCTCTFHMTHAHSTIHMTHAHSTFHMHMHRSARFTKGR